MQLKLRIILMLLCMVCSVTALYAQIQNPVKWSYASKKLNKTEAVLFIRASIDEGWHIYSLAQKPGGPLKTSIVFTPSDGYNLTGTIAEPTPQVVYDEAFDMNDSYFEKSVTFQQKIKLKTDQVIVKGKIKFMTCSGERCITPDDVDFSIPVK